MKVYSIFDDFDSKASKIIEDACGELTIHPFGVPRPSRIQMKRILEEYDCVIIGTSQKITEDMFDRVYTPKIIATASVGLDHIRIPEEKKGLIEIINTPKANSQSVAEYTIGCALSCTKRFTEGNYLYKQGKNNKNLYQKPEDLLGKTIGVVGAGNISTRIMEFSKFFGMTILCWTRNPDIHVDLKKKGVHFVSLKSLFEMADIVSVNLPNVTGTKGLISSDLVESMKERAIFISVSRVETIDVTSLFERAKKNPGFYVCLDIDVEESVIEQIPSLPNVMVTPHIAGGTIETRKRMFCEAAEQISILIQGGYFDEC